MYEIILGSGNFTLFMYLAYHIWTYKNTHTLTRQTHKTHTSGVHTSMLKVPSVSPNTEHPIVLRTRTDRSEIRVYMTELLNT